LDQSYTTAIGGRLDRLPFSRTIWYFVVLIALGGVFELYDLFMTAYIAPGLVKSGLFVAKPPSFFSVTGVGFFIFCTFAGMFVGTMGFGFVADRMERKWQIVCSGVGIGGFMLLFALQSNQIAIIAFGILVTLSNNWLSFTFHNYQAELFPTRVRARAVGFVYSWGGPARPSWASSSASSSARAARRESPPSSASPWC
jgi:MFS transporter, putative metabolite:H+ symporter